MRTMNKSFIFGIIVASITWSISIYLYWNLIHNNVSNNVLLPVPTSDSIEIADKQNKLHTNINSINNIELHANERLSMNKLRINLLIIKLYISTN